MLFVWMVVISFLFRAKNQKSTFLENNIILRSIPIKSLQIRLFRSIKRLVTVMGEAAHVFRKNKGAATWWVAPL
jgi:hypothetical protein